MTAAPSAHANGAPQILVLDDTLDLAAASDLARVLIGMRGSPLRVDPSNVRRLGAQCVQVLISASKAWAADGIAFVVAPGSRPFTEGLHLLGLATFFSSERTC